MGGLRSSARLVDGPTEPVGLEGVVQEGIFRPWPREVAVLTPGPVVGRACGATGLCVLAGLFPHKKGGFRSIAVPVPGADHLFARGVLPYRRASVSSERRAPRPGVAAVDAARGPRHDQSGRRQRRGFRAPTCCHTNGYDLHLYSRPTIGGVMATGTGESEMASMPYMPYMPYRLLLRDLAADAPAVGRDSVESQRLARARLGASSGADGDALLASARCHFTHCRAGSPGLYFCRVASRAHLKWKAATGNREVRQTSAISTSLLRSRTLVGTR